MCGTRRHPYTRKRPAGRGLPALPDIRFWRNETIQGNVRALSCVCTTALQQPSCSGVRPAGGAALNSGRRGSRPSNVSTETKAVLEHRAPKTSPPILHTRGVESKVGRAVHCAPVWVMLTRLLGWNPGVRALTGAATLICSAVAAVCDRQVQLPRTLPDCLAAPVPGENRRRSQNAATKAVECRAPL